MTTLNAFIVRVQQLAHLATEAEQFIASFKVKFVSGEKLLEIQQPALPMFIFILSILFILHFQINLKKINNNINIKINK
jgi:dolichol kinase